MLSRVKGHGKRATYVVRGFQDASGWHIKLRPGNERYVLSNEAKRINWARKQTTLPVTKTAGSVGAPFVGLLFTRTVTGVPAHHLIETLGPVRLVDALSDGMKVIQSQPSNARFPFAPPKWATDKEVSIRSIRELNRLRNAGKRLHPGFDELSNRELVRVIETGPENYDGRTYVHGDLCMPNMLMSQDGAFTGLIDLGALHVGDPVLDIALLSWCINDNLGPKWSEYFLSKHGLNSKDSRIQFYRLAYDLSLNFPDAWAWTMSPKLVQRRAKLEGVEV